MKKANNVQILKIQSFAWVFANFSLLFIKALLIKKMHVFQKARIMQVIQKDLRSCTTLRLNEAIADSQASLSWNLK